MKIQKVSKVISSIAFLFFTAGHTMAAAVDTDGDGLIEINNLDDLNEIRNDVYGTSLRGSSEGCPVETGCLGYELTRDLDFDSNGNGRLDSGDWNAGQSWVPVTGDVSIMNATFGAIFDGNGHIIRNLRINTIANYRDYGLFGNTYKADIRNLGFVNSVINVSTDLSTHIGTLIGSGYGTNVSNCYVNNGVINTSNHSAHVVGGLVGSMGAGFSSVDPLIKNTYFNGSITTGGNAAGLVGFINIVNIENSYAKGAINGRYVGGLVANIYGGDLINNFANVQIVASVNAGGLLDALGQGNTTIRNSYALGSINASSFAGGLVRSISYANVVIANSYANNQIQIGNNKYANLISIIHQDGNVSFSISDSYWVKNPQGIVLSDGSSALGNGGQLLADLQCATNSFDTACAIPGLLQDWDGAIWDFGNTSQLPALKLVSNFPWVSTDKPDATGDHESVARLSERNPEYTCDSPTNFHAKEKNTGYIFKVKTPDVLRYFNTTQGLACVHADQTTGSCGNYEVSYLCSNGGTNSWTSWRSSDTNNGTGDYETHASGCATTPLAIKTRIVGKTSVHYSTPQKLNQFSLQKGLTCLNSDNNCRDYQVRMVCDILGDR